MDNVCYRLELHKIKASKNSASNELDVVEEAVLQLPKETLLRQFSFTSPWPSTFVVDQTISIDNDKAYGMTIKLDELWARFLPSR